MRRQGRDDRARRPRHPLASPRRHEPATTRPRRTLTYRGSTRPRQVRGTSSRRSDAIRKLALAVLVTATLAPATSSALAGTAHPALDRVHQWRDATQATQRQTGQAVTRYLWIPDRATMPRAARWHAAVTWYHRYRAARASPAWPVPAWFVSDASCISQNEEYGFYGENTSAGKFGMSSGPPSAYPEPGPTLARLHGDSWLDLGLADQLRIVYAEYLRYGWSPWTTAPGCGL